MGPASYTAAARVLGKLMYTSIVALVTAGSRRELHWLQSKDGGNRVSSKGLPAWGGLKTLSSNICVTL